MTDKIIRLGLHKRQLEVLRDNHRRVLLVSGRRFGKSRVSLVRAFVKCLETKPEIIDPLSPPVILVAMPTLVMARRVLWRPLVQMFNDIPNVDINNTERRISIPGRAPIVVTGLENYDAIRGMRIIHAHVDEGQDIPYRVFTEVLFPAMADTPGSTLFVTGTPKGKANWLYTASTSPEFSFHNYPTSDNPFVPREEIERARAILPPNVFRQEFEASFVDFEGRLTVFDAELHTVDIAKVAAAGSLGTVTVGGIDWGDCNPATVICRVEGIGTKPVMTIIDAIQFGDGRNPVTEDELFKRIAELSKRYQVTRFFADPSRPAAILSMRQFGHRHDIKGMAKVIAGDNKIIPGISSMNAGFSSGSLKVAKHLTSFCDELINYHRVITKDGQYLDAVAPGQNDHCLDAARYAFFTFNNRNKYLLTGGLSL